MEWGSKGKVSIRLILGRKIICQNNMWDALIDIEIV